MFRSVLDVKLVGEDLGDDEEVVVVLNVVLDVIERVALVEAGYFYLLQCALEAEVY